MVRVIDGTIRKGQQIRMVSTQQTFTVEQVGVITPKYQDVDELTVGEVGYVEANIKRVADTKIGDTITEAARPTLCAFPRISGNQAHGIRRALPDGQRRIRSPPGCPFKTAVE